LITNSSESQLAPTLSRVRQHDRKKLALIGCKLPFLLNAAINLAFLTFEFKFLRQSVSC